MALPAAMLLLLAQTAPADAMVVDATPAGATNIDMPQQGDALAHFDLAQVKPAPSGRCPTQPRDEIVVCGVKASDIAIDEARYREHPFTQFKLLGANADVAATQRSLPGGISAPAMMLNLKWKF
jgi:hypothetical protein